MGWKLQALFPASLNYKSNDSEQSSGKELMEEEKEVNFKDKQVISIICVWSKSLSNAELTLVVFYGPEILNMN